VQAECEARVVRGSYKEHTRSTGPKLPFRTTLPGYPQGAGMRGVSPDRKQGGQRMVRGRQRL
jgi:hypothetical protein